MFAPFSRQASRGTSALRRLLEWPARVSAARKTMTQLAAMSDHQLRDIGLTRQDLHDVSALPIDADPAPLLERRRSARVKLRPRRNDLAA